MKFTLGRAHNEALELIVGDLLIALGGVLLGLVFADITTFNWLIPICIFFFVFGVIFDIRALNKFKYDLGEIRNDVNTARDELRAIITESQQTRRELDSAKNEIHKVTTELQRTKSDLDRAKRELNDAEKKLEQTNEKVFGSSGGTFSKSSWAHPIEEKIEEMKKQIKSLESDVRELQRKTSRGF